MILQLYMRSGNIIEVPVKRYEVKYLGEHIMEINWETHEDRRRNPESVCLKYVDPTAVEAVVQVGASPSE